YRYFLAFDPRPTLEKVKVPVLALNGENDLQVPSKENLDLIAAALKAGNNKDFTVKSFPKLNHLFQTSQTGSPNEYDKIEETISPIVLEEISNWILKRTAGK
ncbi:MAG TPA: prolyl oligopeptidase family serine peptidase, partial [Pyrinomonadaceae bacterium]|nr:prolyl oligopeptidase family serine peptidase [Pyrinomonadaceae bacterium]